MKTSLPCLSVSHEVMASFLFSFVLVSHFFSLEMWETELLEFLVCCPKKIAVSSLPWSLITSVLI